MVSGSELALGFRVSPDSVIFAADSSSSLFSSASGTVERCSFASDGFEHHASYDLPQSHSAAREIREASCGPAPDPYNPAVPKNNHFCRQGKSKECQGSRFISEALLNKPDRRVKTSLDLKCSAINATISSSPRFGVMKKASITSHSGAFPSPVDPNYRHSSVGMPKGWSSERVPSHTSAHRSKYNNSLPPHNNGRALPSKWEDAERWIFSPVSGAGALRTSFQQPQRQRKSKSGPLGPYGAAYYSLCSSSVPVSEGGYNVNYVACSESWMARSISIHGCSELLSLSSMDAPQDDKVSSDRDAATNISHIVSRRDMATQISPKPSPHASPRRQSPLSSSTSSTVPIVEVHSVHSSRAEVKDVPDEDEERVTVTRCSKKHRAQIPGKSVQIIDNWNAKAVETHSTGWEISETKSISKSLEWVKREEAKITMWENLQKEKAEAAIRKLEMKLEKKRSSYMAKIMNKLRASEKKAEEMRSSMLTTEVTRTSQRPLSFHPTRQMSSLSGCFTCPAF